MFSLTRRTLTLRSSPSLLFRSYTVPTPAMDSPEKKPQTISNGNEPPRGQEAKDLGFGDGEPIEPPKAGEGKAAGEQQYEEDGRDKRGKTGKTA